MRAILLLFTIAACSAACVKNDDTGKTAFSPAITGFEPKAAGRCDWFKIEGSFDTVLTNNQVSINGVSAEVVFASDTALVVRVPENATSGLITVTVGGEMVSSSEGFTLLKGYWNRLPDFPGEGRFQAIGFVIGDKIYFGTGSQGSRFYDDFWEFDPATGQWAQKASYPGGVLYSAVGFSIGNKGYLGLGGDEEGNFYEYDPATDTWTQIASFPNGYRLGAIAFSLNGKGYVGAGQSYWMTNPNDYSFWEYDPAADAWSELSSAPPDVERVSGVGFTFGNKGYIGAGGYDNLKDFHAYDPVAETWSPVAELPSDESKYSSNAMVIDNLVYVRIRNEFWSYNPVLDVWTQVAAPCGSPRYSESGFAVGGKIYLICGLGSARFEGMPLFPGMKLWDTQEVWEFTPEE